MFTPLVAKARGKAPASSALRSPLATHWPGRDPADQLEQRATSLPRNEPRGSTEHATDPTNSTIREPALSISWDISKIPLYPPQRAGGSELRSPVPARRLLPSIQAKLKVGATNDPLEHEADRVAEQVMRMPAPELAPAAMPPQIGRKGAGCEEEEVRKTPNGSAASGLREASTSVHSVLRSPGQPLDEATRAYFEPRFGRDFSEVRVHNTVAAEQSAKNVNAHAYTVGRNIVFGTGNLAPATQEGRRLIAHELTHVVQQQAMTESQIQRQPSNSGLSIHIKIGDSTRLNKDYKWHFDSIPDKLKEQLSKQVRDAFAFLPKQFPLAVEWGQFKATDLKNAGNIQVWLIPEDDPDLARPIMTLYGYSKAPIEAAINDLGNVVEHQLDDDTKRESIGVTPVDTADTTHDPMTARPVFVKVPDEFSQEINPVPEFKKAHPEATPSRRLALLGDTALHELGHVLGLGHADKGTIGAADEKTGQHEQSFPPDIMDKVEAALLHEFSDAHNMRLTKAELDALGGENALRQNPIVTKVEIDPKTHEANVWIDPTKLKYSKEEQDVLLNNLKNLVLFVDAKKKSDAEAKKVSK